MKIYKIKKIKISKRFINDMPCGVEVLNSVNDKFYVCYYDTKEGKIKVGMFLYDIAAGNNSFNGFLHIMKRYNRILDIKDKVLYKVIDPKK